MAAAAALAAMALLSCAPKDAAGGAGGKAASETLRIGAAFAVAGKGGIGDSAYEGLRLLAEERSGAIAGGSLEAEFGPAFRIECLWSRLGSEDYEQVLRYLAGKSQALVLCSGGDFLQAAMKVASAYPQTAFVVLDAPYREGARDAPPNLTTASFACDEGAFLAGAFAARTAALKGGFRIGFVGGMDRPDLRACLASYRAGAAYALPSFRASSSVMGRFCGRAESGFSDPAGAKSIAASMFASGASIVFHLAGDSGRGVFEAALDSGALAIGSDYDQGAFYRSSRSARDREIAAAIALSMVKRGDVAARLFVREYLASGALPGGDRRLGVAQGCVDIVMGAGTAKGLADEMAAIRAELASGRMALPAGEAAVSEPPRPKK